MKSTGGTTTDDQLLPFPFFIGLTIASIGGPLALVALYIPQTLDGAATSAGLVTVTASLLFLLPLAVWLRYSERVASNGGLYAFVEAAAGRRVARIQAGFWIISYFLYLVYTVPFIVYDLLPVVFPLAVRSRLLVDAGLALLVAVIMLSPRVITFSTLAVLAVLELVLTIVMAAVNLIRFGIPANAFVGHGDLGPVVLASGKTSTLFICASLPLFVAGEVRGGGRAVRRGLAWSYGAVALLCVLAVFPLAKAGGSALGADLPAVALNQPLAGRGVAILITLCVAASVAGLIVAEFIALSRLLGTILMKPSRRMITFVSAVFLAGSLVSLVNPSVTYQVLLRPSLVALWISQLIVVGAYPWFVRRYRQLVAGDVLLAGGATILMAFALIVTVMSASGT